MADLTQGSPLANITTNQTQTTTAPDWYTNYLNNLSAKTTADASNAQYVGANDIQNQAFSNVQNNVGNYQPALDAAGNLTLDSATTTAPSVVDQYMNPYINDVVNRMGDLSTKNIMNVVAPQTTAGIVGSGQFGSQRGASVLGSNLSDYEQNTLAQQAGALSSGYNSAITAAQNDLNRQMTGGNQMNTIATNTQNLGLGDVNALATLGAQQQQIEQNQQLFPLNVDTSASSVLKGFTVPTSVTNTYTGPIPGAYTASPLSLLGSGGAGLISLFTPNSQGVTPWQGIQSAWTTLFGNSGGGGGNNTAGASDTNIDTLA